VPCTASSSCTFQIYGLLVPQESNDAKNLVTSFQESHFKVEIKLRSNSKAERNDPNARRERMRRLLTSMREDSKNKQTEDVSSTSDRPVQEEISQEEGQTSVGAVLEHSQMEGDLSKDMEVSNEERENVVLNDGEIDCEAEPGQDEFMKDKDLEDEDTDEDYFSGQDSESDIHSRSEYDEFAEFEWLEVMDGFVSHTRGSPDPTEHKQIGFCDGKLIRREKIRDVFYSSMEEPSEETCLLAFDLFDRYGRLRPEFKKHPVRKGSGVWNEELDVGDILLIEFLMIDEGYRRQGLGKKVVTAMLETAKTKTERPLFAAVRPAYLRRVEEEERFQGKSRQELDRLLLQDEKIATEFYRSLGFRRIGSSTWFGLASDPNHPSHSVPISGDYDPPQPKHAPPDEGLQQILKMEETEDSQVFNLLEQFRQKCPETDPRWLATDEAWIGYWRELLAPRCKILGMIMEIHH
jgi:GNAT superfamily N-acetyltransferase